MEKIITYVLTNHLDKQFIEDFYTMDNFIRATDAILLLKVDYFVSIIESNTNEYRFRLIIHEGILNRGGFSRSEAMLSELEASFPNLKKNELVFITRSQEKFPNQEPMVKDALGFHLNFNKCNIKTIADGLPVYTKTQFNNVGSLSIPQSAVDSKLQVEPEKNVEFAIITALYNHEFNVFETHCNLERSSNIYNSYLGKFKNVKKSAVGEDYNKSFLVAHQEQMGLVDAAIHSTQIITIADPKFIIMPGVCGGREGEVNQYDIIIPSKVFDYATGKFKNGKLETLGYEASMRKELFSYLDKHKDQIILNMRSMIDSDRKGLMSSTFKIIIDEFACGPWVVKTEGVMRKIAGDHRKKRFINAKENNAFLDSLPVNKISNRIKGLEMESYSVLRAGEIIQHSNKYSLVVKSVMDFTNENKSDGVFEEIKSSAAYLSYLCVRAMMPLLLEFEKNVDTWKKQSK